MQLNFIRSKILQELARDEEFGSVCTYVYRQAVGVEIERVWRGHVWMDQHVYLRRSHAYWHQSYL